MSLDEAGDYRGKADECRRNAEAASDSVAKSHWLEAADDWLFQAENVEARNLRLPANSLKQGNVSQGKNTVAIWPMALNHPHPWNIRDLGTCFKIESADGRNLAYVYYRKDGARLDKYLTHEQARDMAQAIARLSL